MKGGLIVAVTRDRYSTKFNVPKPSRHTIRPTIFVPTHRVSPHIEGITVLWPTRCDLIHTINRIPILTKKKFVISFESHLPRYFWGEKSRFFKYMRGYWRHLRAAGLLLGQNAPRKSSLRRTQALKNSMRWQENSRSFIPTS